VPFLCVLPWITFPPSTAHKQWVDAVFGIAVEYSSNLEHFDMQAVQHEGLSGLVEQSGLADSATVARDLSLKGPAPKNVAFELLLDENSKVRARIPMRVQIYPHDTTDSIVTTVKNFYGIYDGTASGVSFEDEHGTTLIARYENLKNNRTVYVRVIPIQPYGDHFYNGFNVEPRKRPSLAEPFQMVDGTAPLDQPSRPASRLARKRSTSPSNRSLRSASQHKPPSRAGNKSRTSSSHGGFHDDDDDYSDTESAYARRARNELFASSDISMENILQDGRRKRPKFDSSVSDSCRTCLVLKTVTNQYVPLRSSPCSFLPKCPSLPPPPLSLPNAGQLVRKALGRLSHAHRNARIAINMRFHRRKAMVTANMATRGAIRFMRLPWFRTMEIACATREPITTRVAE
jgi:hypothetical protein